ncbi:MAG: DUF11 domain-containing protein [Pirellulales bacterium]|nr:DUF11 domain-containing protein [Pirellulales bacterium]
MKRLVLRLSVLSAVVLVGCIAIAYAQHQSDASELSIPDSNTSTLTLGAPSNPATVLPQPNPLRGARDGLGLRESSPPTYSPPSIGDSTVSNDGVATVESQPSGEPPLPTPPPDPFGIQAARESSNAEPPGGARVDSSPGSGGYAVEERRSSASSAPAWGADRNGAPNSVGNGAADLYPASTNGLAASTPSQPPRNYPQQDATLPNRDDRPGQFETNPYVPRLGAEAPRRFENESPPQPLANDCRTTVPPASSYDDSSNLGQRTDDLGQRTGDSRLSTSSTANEGTGQPAMDRRLDGQQTPQLTIQKIAPEEIQVGKTATFKIEVKNTGTVTAENVEIRDEIPQGTELFETEPEATRGTRGELVWRFDKIEPNGGASVKMRVTPLVEGEIGSVATVYFGTSASARSHATKPELALNVSAPKTLMIEGEMTVSITVSNPGSGAATNVVLEEHVPPCLQHPAGAELEYEVGNLAPNESKSLDLQLTAVRPGQGSNVLIARADAVAEVKKELPIEVVAPELKVAMSGPKTRYLERQATYELAVSNPGTAPARDVRLTAELPRGLKFVSADKNAHYDPQTRTVQWALAELPTGKTGTVQLTTLPVEIGRHAVQFRGTADKALAVEEKEQISVDGITALRFEVVDVKDPIEVGAETVYEIRVLNQGSKEATHVVLEAMIPRGLDVVAAEGPDGPMNRNQGNHVVFDPLSRLSPKADVTYRVRVKGREPGDQRISVRLMAAELQGPVTKEESTRVFSDR